jgi:hypothetical protein
LLLAGAVAYYASCPSPLLILIAIVLSQWIDPEMLLQASSATSMAGPGRIEGRRGELANFLANKQVVGGCHRSR